MMLCSGVRSIVLCTSKLFDRASDGLNFISAINSFRSLVAKIRSEPLNAQSDGLELHSTILCTSLYITNSKSNRSVKKQSKRERQRNSTGPSQSFPSNPFLPFTLFQCCLIQLLRSTKRTLKLFKKRQREP
ncbi:hypothetical protein RHMOL_Rhmol05G0081000 [Rhododendron molle]|nr:hypothetical protein RHMOL_Rhmol05G0081000 [Rhododendron molle]